MNRRGEYPRFSRCCNADGGVAGRKEEAQCIGKDAIDQICNNAGGGAFLSRDVALNALNQVAQFVALRAKVANVLLVRLGFDRHAVDDLKSEPADFHDFARVVRNHADAAQPQVGKDLSADAGQISSPAHRSRSRDCALLCWRRGP